MSRQSLLSRFEETIDFAHQFQQLLWVLLHRSPFAQGHPGFSVLNFVLQGSSQVGEDWFYLISIGHGHGSIA